MKTAPSLLLTLFAVAVAEAAEFPIPDYHFTTDISRPLVQRVWTIKQRASFRLYWHFERDGSPLDLSGVSQVAFAYGPEDNTWSVSVPAAVSGTATAGTVLVNFAPANTDTNGAFLFDLMCSDSGGTNVMLHAYGRLTILPRAGGAAAFPLGTNVDLSTYTFINVPWATGTPLYVESDAVFTGWVAATDTNLLLRQGTVNGTGTVYVTVNGTNYHWRLW